MPTTTSLWPDFPSEVPPRGMRQMLEEAGGDIGQKTGGTIEFRVKVFPEGNNLIHDCYLVVPRVGYQHLLLRVITGAKPFPAHIATTHEHNSGGVLNEESLRHVLKSNFQSQETREIVGNLIANFAPPAE